MRAPPKILLAGLAALAMTIAPILSLDGATCGGFIYTIDKTLTTTPNACTALIENLRVDRSLLMSEGVADLIETSTTAVVGINFAVIGMLAVHTVLVFFDKFSMVASMYFICVQVGVAMLSTIAVLASTPILPAEQAVAPYMTVAVALGALVIW